MHTSHDEPQLHGTPTGLGRYQDYLAEFVYGGIDGSITTFAVVAGSAGAGLDSSIILILGFANLLADGFSMSVGSYLSHQAERDAYEKNRQIEYDEVDQLPEQERDEIREIYRGKGFEGELLEKVVEVITADRDRWVNVMMKEELEMIPSNKPALGMALATFVAFVIVGFIPLLVYVLDYAFTIEIARRFEISSGLTLIAFALIGFFKSRVNEKRAWRGVLETVLLGVTAAVVAYAVGHLLEHWLAG
ncbi:Predicted Fe2+/Mn2+ transporter, VIT1/CCC1 family [Catalinimonas alkaloidigena]|uniref:Predicted Fe2+/Mn2+ transporter, VIT1/CCC1 family n=1 Tax=Catalinimonas alkaloidigena TaxID=1075417 RepID=A0A1G9AMS2_9BACT|nr:VIT1/CCC1 transporter family protein [Catalinimonas alkaloidigena]SDK28622.1 Predicted Fe2+/Mn2+ transporter, VIT1/CCC1 family [Catalinimonas alkaloidigena]